jgi:hypothetical protein
MESITPKDTEVKVDNTTHDEYDNWHPDSN